MGLSLIIEVLQQYNEWDGRCYMDAISPGRSFYRPVVLHLPTDALVSTSLDDAG